MSGSSPPHGQPIYGLDRHKRLVRDMEREHNWTAVEEHLRRLSRLRPDHTLSDSNNGMKSTS